MKSDWQLRFDELIREARNDSRTLYELISQALCEPDEDAAWECVSILHRRGTRETFDAARLLCQSSCAIERTLGTNILGQLGCPDSPFIAESVAVLLALLQAEVEENVLRAICIALSFLHDLMAVPAIARLHTHPSHLVRYAAVYGLSGHSDSLAIETLIKLSSDTHELVRDWATFGLGRQIDDDTPAIREALFRRTSDIDSFVRCEALFGLAHRGDEHAVEPLIDELNVRAPTEIDSLLVKAAEEIADPRLLGVLERLKHAAGAEGGRFDAAIANCSK